MSLSTYPEKTDPKYSFGNKYSLPTDIYKGVVFLAEDKAVEAVAPLTPTGVALADGATINTDASLGSDFHVELGGNRNFAAPTNEADWKVLRYWIKQDATGSRTATWDAVFRFSTGIPSPTLTTTAHFMDMIEFVYNPTYETYDCIRVVQGFDSTP